MTRLLQRLALLGGICLATAVQADDKTIYFYNWSEYVPDGLLTQFEQESGYKVIYSTYESNETLYTKLKTHANAGYDLVVPSTYFVAKMAGEGMLQPLDKTRLPNLKHLDPSLLDKEYDPGNRYSLPYIWGATAIGINQQALNTPVTRWQQLWDPQFKNSLLLTDDAREVFHIALLQLGYSPNTQDAKQIGAAFELLKKLAPNVKAFNSDNPADPFIAGEVNLGMLWNGSAYAAQQEDGAIDLIYPEEGAIFWMDNMAIPAGAKNVAGAHALINFLLRPEVAAQVAQTIGYPTPNQDAIALLPEAIRSNAIIFPSPAAKAKGVFQSDVGEAATLYQDYFQQFKALVAQGQ